MGSQILNNTTVPCLRGRAKHCCHAAMVTVTMHRVMFTECLAYHKATHRVNQCVCECAGITRLRTFVTGRFQNCFECVCACVCVLYFVYLINKTEGDCSYCQRMKCGIGSA